MLMFPAILTLKAEGSIEICTSLLVGLGLSPQDLTGNIMCRQTVCSGRGFASGVVYQTYYEL